MPSWAIDWQLTSQLFKLDSSLIRSDLGSVVLRRFENPWNKEDTKSLLRIVPSTTETPEFHHQFCENNTMTQEDDFTKLRVKVQVLKRSHIRIIKQTVEIGTFNKNEKLLGRWNVQVSVCQDDTIVHILEWGLNHSVHDCEYRLWLLRPVSKSCFELIACLVTSFNLLSRSSDSEIRTDLYEMWTLDRNLAENNCDLIHVTTEGGYGFWDFIHCDYKEEMLDPVSILTIV
jgi:hypothetical protein